MLVIFDYNYDFTGKIMFKLCHLEDVCPLPVQREKINQVILPLTQSHTGKVIQT